MSVRLAAGTCDMIHFRARCEVRGRAICAATVTDEADSGRAGVNDEAGDGLIHI